MFRRIIAHSYIHTRNYQKSELYRPTVQWFQSSDSESRKGFMKLLEGVWLKDRGCFNFIFYLKENFILIL